MATNPERFGVIRLSASQLQQPELLTGLDLWLQLGLLSSAQVEQFCQEYLTCTVPIAEPATQINLARPLSESPTDFAPIPATEFADAISSSVAPAARRDNWLTRMLQAFMAEIGVIWLLCLGVFMVVVSSAVLAASQWQNVAPIGQYGILGAYTLAFWGVSLWTGRKATLQLTTRMLQTATLLIIPLNFWLMDALQLWQSGLGIAVSLLAALVLSAVMLRLITSLATSHPRQTGLNTLGLSWLHWGWAIPGMPLLAAYIGTIGTAFLTYRNQSEQTDAAEPRFSLSTLITVLATLLLLGRAILAAQVPLSQLGLAFGICGWLFCWLTRRSDAANPISQAWTKIGMALLGLGWAVSVAGTPPWQAFAVSGIALWLLGDRLRWRHKPLLLITLLLLGLQTYLLLWRLLPISFQQTVLSTAVAWFGVDGMPIGLLGLAGFPYLWIMLTIAGGLRQRQSKLATLTDLLALGLGGILLVLSLNNPPVRAISLSLAAITLTTQLRHRPLAPGWLYGNHLLILVAIAAWINVIWAELDALAWARILLLGMAIEWSLSIGAPVIWRRSCWHFGLGMAGLSYFLLPNWLNGLLSITDQNLIWIVTPVLLTGLSRLRQFYQPRTAAWISAASLIAQLFLLNHVNAWLLSLAVATGLMLINTLRLKHLTAALLTLAFGLGCEAMLIYRYFPDLLTFERIMILLAVNLWLLWLLESGLARLTGLTHRLADSSQQIQLYAEAANLWAGTIGLFSLISLSLQSLLTYALATYFLAAKSSSGELLISSSLIAAAFAYRIWRNRAQEPLLYGFAWAVELVAVTAIDWRLDGQQALQSLAIVTLAFGLFSQLSGDWLHRSGQAYRRSWHLIPLLYAGFGALLGHYQFTATTGLYLFAAALTGIGVGRRTAALKPLTLIALLLSSVAVYELLVYQLLQSRGGNPGDGITLLAGLAAAIAVSYRLGQRWLLPYLRLERQSLAWIAHLHWGFGSGLAFFALLLGISDSGFWLWLLFTTVLSLYALLHGRHTPNPETGSDQWTYLGIAEALCLISYALYRTVPDTNLLTSWAATLAVGVAMGLYFLPWRSWGWSQRPWQQMALLLPGVIVLLTATAITLQSLLISAAFYAWIAKTEQRPRLGYLSLGLFNWAAWRYLASIGWLNLTWSSSLLTISLLYIAQLDPALQGTSAREQRHWLRSLAVGLLSLTLFYQAEIETNPTAFTISLITLGLAIGLVLLGLALRVRAFLYVGTIAFILKVLRLLGLFINQYSLLLWAVGIVLGLLFIWIAATFEARRSQMSALMQYWLNEFANWE